MRECTLHMCCGRLGEVGMETNSSFEEEVYKK